MTVRILIGIILVGTLMACSRAEDPQVAVIKNRLVNDFYEAESLVRDSLAGREDNHSPGEAMEKFFKRRAARGSEGGCTVALLGPDMRYLAGRYLGTQGTEIKIVDSALKDYKYLRESFEGLEKGEMAQSILFYRKDKLYVVAQAVKEGQTVLGYLFFAYHEQRFKKDWDISDDQFLSIDFGKSG